MKKTRFLLFGSPITVIKTAMWVGSIMFLGSLAEYIGLTFFLMGEFDLNLIGRISAFVIMASFACALFVGYVAISKLEYVEAYCKERGITEDEFYARDVQQIQEEWLESIAEKKSGVTAR